MFKKASLVMRLAFQDLKGNAPVHIIAGAIISASFLTLGIFVLIAVNLRSMTNYWEENIEVVVYLEEDADQITEETIKAKLTSFSSITNVEYIGKDKALSDFKNMLGDEKDLIEGLDENPLPASFVITLSKESKSLKSVKNIAKDIKVLGGVAEVDYGGPLFESFSSGIKIIEGAVFAVGALIIIAVVFIISNTIRLTMFSRKDEIGIMRLVGASSIMIRFPFILEGILQGISASALGMIALWGLYQIGLTGISLPGLFAGFTPTFISAPTIVIIIFGGGALGAVGSMSRFKEFLKV
jgi:cell division transport system permease protein